MALITCGACSRWPRAFSAAPRRTGWKWPGGRAATACGSQDRVRLAAARERSRRHRLWITHRSWTHWGIAWLALLAYSYQALGHRAWAPLPFGFAAGGVMHLLADWPNPLGVPWLVGRHSLRLWKSGRCDIFVIAAAWLAALIVSDHVFFQNIHSLRMVAFVKSLSMWS